MTPLRLRQAEGEESRAGGYGNVLSAVDGVGHRRRINRSAALEVPQGFASGGVERDEVAFGVAGEDQPAIRRKNARPGWRRVFPFPCYFAGLGIECA